MNWFADHRQQWIAETLRVFGFINRGHIERKFGISTPQASMDLREFQRRNPTAIEYDTRRKCYVAQAADRPSPDVSGVPPEGQARSAGTAREAGQ